VLPENIKEVRVKPNAPPVRVVLGRGMVPPRVRTATLVSIHSLVFAPLVRWEHTKIEVAKTVVLVVELENINQQQAKQHV
jgi:hypothetical protein